MNALTGMTIFADTYGSGGYGSCGVYSSGSCATTQTNNTTNTTVPGTTNTTTPANTTNSTANTTNTTNTTNSTSNTQSNQPETFTITPASQLPKSTSHLGLEVAIGATVIGIAIFGTVIYRIIVRKRQKSLFYPTHNDDAGSGNQQHQ